MGRKVRTNIVIDEDLVAEVMQTYALRSKRAAVEFALRSVLGKREQVDDRWKAMLELEGIWAGMSDEEAFSIYDPDAQPGGEEP